MYKILPVLFIFSLILPAAAQKQHFDIVSFTPPKGWKKELRKNAMMYSVTDARKQNWCMLTVFTNEVSEGGVEKDLLNAWTVHSATPLKITAAPTITETVGAGGWNIKSASGMFHFNNTDAVSTVTTVSGFGKSISIQANTNNQLYLEEISAFIGSLEMDEINVQPSVNSKSLRQDVTKAAISGFTFTKTDFDDGWSGSVKDDWVEVSKGTLRILIHYPNKEADAYQSVLKDEDLKAWNILVAPRYSNIRNFEWKSIQSWESVSFMEADLLENSTGKNVHVILFKKHYSKGNGRYMEFVTGSKAEYEKEFGSYHRTEYDWDKTANMQWRNKFAVSPTDLIGKWSNSDYSSLTYYYVNTGGTAGTNTVSTADSYTFLTTSTYKSQHSGASGMVGNLKFYNQEYKGDFSTTNWELTMTNRFHGKTEKFSCQFEAVKGGRILILIDHLGTVFTLGKGK